MRKDTYCFVSPDKTPADVIEVFRRFYGPTMECMSKPPKPRARKTPSHRSWLTRRARNNIASIGAGILCIPATFLRVTVSR